MSSNFKAHAAMLSASVIYGLNYTVAKGVMPNYIGPYGFVLLRVVGAGLLFWLLFSLVRGKDRIERKDWWRLALCAFFGVATNQLMFFAGLNLTTPINAAIILTTNPIAVLIIAWFLIGERISLQKIIGIGLGLSGALMLIILTKESSFGTDTFRGDILIFINSVSYGFYLVLAKPLMKKYSPLTVIKWVFTIGLIYVVLYPGSWSDLSPGTSVQEVMAIDWLSMPTGIFLSVVYVIVMVTFLTYLLNIYALKTVSPSVISMYIYLQPLLAAFFAILLGKDSVDWIKIVSAIVIFAGVYMVSRR